MNDKTSSKRPVKQEYNFSKQRARRNARRAAAEARQAVYAATPIEERLAGLDRRDLGARRERARLYPILHNVAIVPNKKRAVQS